MTPPVLVTGAGGFLGRATIRALAALPGDLEVILADRDPVPLPDRRFSNMAGDITDPDYRKAILQGRAIVIHMAAVPGGAAEADPDLSRRVNLDASLAIMDALSSRREPARFVYASSIAVFGTPLPDHIDHKSRPAPSLTYGAHKLMVETALSDLTRRGGIEGIALRFPGLVARPASGAGLRSAFLSEIFHAMARGDEFTLPVGPSATSWLMSVHRAALNLLFAAFTPRLPSDGAVFTLPVIRASMADLVEGIRTATKSRSVIGYDPNAMIEAQFGSLPPLDAQAALNGGFLNDGTLDELIAAALGAIYDEDAAQ